MRRRSFIAAAAASLAAPAIAQKARVHARSLTVFYWRFLS